MPISPEDRREIADAVRELAASIRSYSAVQDDPDVAWTLVVARRTLGVVRRLCKVESLLNPELRPFGDAHCSSFKGDIRLVSAMERIQRTIDSIIVGFRLEAQVVSVRFDHDSTDQHGEARLRQRREMDIEDIVESVRLRFQDDPLPRIDITLADDLESVALELVVLTPPALNSRQKRILRALDGKALSRLALQEAARLEAVSGTDFYEDINELRAMGLVDHSPRLGYYRPDKPPPELKSPV